MGQKATRCSTMRVGKSFLMWVGWLVGQRADPFGKCHLPCRAQFSDVGGWMGWWIRVPKTPNAPPPPHPGFPSFVAKQWSDLPAS